MSIDLTLDSSWSIELTGDHSTAYLAARELQTFLTRLGAPTLPITSAADGPRIALHHGPEGDGFVRAPDRRGLLLRGEGPRGLLYAVYDLLEALGCRWPAPEPDAERVPRHATLTLPRVAVADQPGLARRGLIIGHDLFLAEAERWIVWAARNRLNTIFIHTTIREPALGACRLAAWRARRAALLPLIRERMLHIELGGHHLRDLLPRRLFRIRPDWFRYDGRRRTPDYNLCVSSPEALAYIQDTAAALFQVYPEAEVYHLWPDDLLGGGWCRCDRCAGLSPADQAMIAANALAEALPNASKEARVALLAYHDTEAPPVSIMPHPRAAVIFAPRRRSYAAGMDAPINAGVAERLARYIAMFRAANCPVAVFEYYLDGILFKSAPPPLTEVIAADLRRYCAAGVNGAHVLLTGDRPFVAASPNAYLFARLAWSPTTDADAILTAYAAARAPSAAAALVTAWTALEHAWRPALERDPEQTDPQPPGHDPIARPPADVLDYPLHEPQRAAERRLEALRTAETHLLHGRRVWDADLALATLASERAEWELGATLLRFLRLRQQLYVLHARAADAALLAETLAEAQAALNDLLAWADIHVPPEAQSGHRLLRMAFQLQLDHIADLHLLNPLGRLGLRLRRAGALAGYGLRTVLRL